MTYQKYSRSRPGHKTISQVAQLLDVHPNTVHYWLKLGRVTAVTFSTAPKAMKYLTDEDVQQLALEEGKPIPVQLVEAGQTAVGVAHV